MPDPVDLERLREFSDGTDDGVLNQTHFCEAQQEIDATLKQYQGFRCEAELYDHHGLFNQNSVLAHCTLLGNDDFAAVGGQHACRAFAEARSASGDDEYLACDVHACAPLC